jgi:hypothetical protein
MSIESDLKAMRIQEARQRELLARLRVEEETARQQALWDRLDEEKRQLVRVWLLENRPIARQFGYIFQILCLNRAWHLFSPREAEQSAAGVSGGTQAEYVLPFQEKPNER